MKSIYIATNLGQFIRKIAIDYVRYNYYRYAVRTIPPNKDPSVVDTTIIECYGITSCRQTRSYRRQKGYATVAYVRFGHTFILLATEGRHEEIEQRTFYDIRIAPLHISGYSIGIRGGKPVVLIASKRMRKISSIAHNIALHNSAKVENFISTISPFYYPGIVGQKRKILKRINSRRKIAGLKIIQSDVAPQWPKNKSCKLR